MNCMRLISVTLASVFLAFNAHAQFELKAGNFNGLFIPQNPGVPAIPVGGNENNVPPTLNSNYQGMGQVSSGTGPLKTVPLVPTEHADRFPSNTPDKTIVLTRSTMGGVFTSGVPRYFMGDLILPPLVQADEKTPAAANYWRAKPILPGEDIPGLNIIPLGTVDVTESSTNGAGVKVKMRPSELVVGATLLGQPITRIIGTGPYSVTLAGNANVTISSEAGQSSDITPATPFYYSPHAEKVYGSQPGQISITWVTRLPNEDGIHESLEETFAVSSNTARPVRTIFWTEGAFDGPVVQITDGRISTVNPIFYSAVPKSVPEEVNIPGNEPISPDLSTLSFDKFAGVGQLHAYNVEGRILIEYLGDVRLGDDIYNQIGTDVVDIVRVPPESLETVHLGFEILPHDGDTSLTASPLLSTAQNPVTYYGTNTRPDGSSAYWAERETSAPLNPDNGKPESNNAYNKVVFYWLEQGDFSINWPKFQDRYWQRWSPNLPDYAHYTVDNAGSTPDTGVPFSGGNVPQIVYQDDPAQAEASIDLPTQRLFVTFAAPPADQRNRALLKFSAGSGKVWYVNLYTQGEDRGTTPTPSIASTMVTVPSTAGMTVGMTVTGPGITGEATIVTIIGGTSYILSQDIANATNEFLYPFGQTVLSSTTAGTPTTITIADTSSLLVGDLVYNWRSYIGKIVSILDATRITVIKDPDWGGEPTLYLPDGEHTVSYWTTGFGVQRFDEADEASHFSTPPSTTIVVSSTASLMAGMLVTGPGINGEVTIASITDATHLELSKPIASGTNDLTYTGTPLSSTSSASVSSTFVTVGSTLNLEVGMIVTGTGTGINETVTIKRIIDGTHLVLSDDVEFTNDFTYTVESDDGPPIDDVVIVGTRLLPPAGHEIGGYLSGGSGYYPAGYLNPFVTGITAASTGAIIPVNALPDDKILTVRWFKKVPKPSAEFQDLFVPGKVGRYTAKYPPETTPSRIVIAQGVGTDDLPPAEAAGSIYYQNNRGEPGYNPNDEHAKLLGGRAYALREDLNVFAPYKAPFADGHYTSEPFVLVAYTDPDDDRPAIHAYRVLREIDKNKDSIKDDGDILFDYTATAGTLLVTPYPLPLLNLPLEGEGVDRASKNVEIMSKDAAKNVDVQGASAYENFTFQDRKGFVWVHRGPHDGGTPGVRSSNSNGSTTITVDTTEGLEMGMNVAGPGITETATIVSITDGTQYVLSQSVAAATGAGLTYGPSLEMKLYYLSEAGFFVPGSGEPPLNTMLPFLRHADRSGEHLDLGAIDARPDSSIREIDEPLTIIYRPTWPRGVAELRVGETLALPKFGLPQVRGQKSAQVYYEQSIANAPTASDPLKNSVQLHDPTREKTVALDAVGLDEIPSAIRTTSYQGKTYFQGLPPQLQERFFVDPLRGEKGTLILIGEFYDVLSGEDYLDLNLLTAAEEATLKGLVKDAGSDKTAWEDAINALNTKVETFIPDPAVFGLYKVDPTQTDTVGKSDLALITDPDTAVDSYALTATGQGTGYVTMVFGNGGNPDQQPQGDPVVVQVFKVAEQLYVGDLKVVLSSNPLDEQVTLRHSGDFAGKPEDYEFDWRWGTGAATAPRTYASVMTRYLGNPVANTHNWIVVSDPEDVVATAAQLSAAGPALPFSPGRPINVRPVSYTSNVTTVTVNSTANLVVGMTVTGPGITGTATVESITDTTRYVLSQNIPDTTSDLTYDADGGTLVLSSASVTAARTIIDEESYTDAEMAAGYPGLFLKSELGMDFGPTPFPLGIPDEIVFSAKLGTFDGFVLYVNGKAALAHNAPAALFTLSNESRGLTDIGKSGAGDDSLKQFSLLPSWFNAGPNTIEVAVYTTADANAESNLDFILEAAVEADLVDRIGSEWQTRADPNEVNTNTAIVGGSPTNPFGGPQFVLNDRWFTMRYKPKASANNVLGTQYSRWMPPQFVEGWVKRVLAAINPFGQRVTDLYNNSVNTEVSVIAQAGGRWEGDIALTLDNIDDVGLIEIYETVLNRARSLSIDANTNDPDSNNALLLVAGYLNDLYTLLGNEAFADAANPTISIDDPSGVGGVGEVNTSRFSFESQVANSLEEELALLRGRDNSVSPGVETGPFYNRLFWNYTRGIISGEVIYAVNYNIKEQVGHQPTDPNDKLGVIDEYDAARMFPQGHGDAYGHYLTALTGYYKLLSNDNFTWTPRAEAVTVAGQPVTVDFQDERKLATAANDLTRTAEQIVGLVHRQSYDDDPAQGWEHFSDQTGDWGLDEWVSRSTQGAYYHWAVGNALVPEEDTYHTGVQKIDRTTIPALAALATASTTFQTTIDNANAHLNPLGLSPDAIAFDISPSEMLAGQSHFEQIYGRALQSLNNASGAFTQAASMTRSLRDQHNQIDNYTSVIAEQETSYVNELIDIFGRPYSGEIGAGKVYAQGYAGPDLLHWFIVDRPNDLADTSETFEITIATPLEYKAFTGNQIDDIVSSLDPIEMVAQTQTVTVQPSRFVQYNDVWKSGGLGSRAETGKLQSALQDAQQSWLALSNLSGQYLDTETSLNRATEVFHDVVQTHINQLATMEDSQGTIRDLNGVVLALEGTADALDLGAAFADEAGDAAAEFLPKIAGLVAGLSNGAILDPTSAPRGAAKLLGATGAQIARGAAVAARIGAGGTEIAILGKEQGLERALEELGFANEELQLAYEFDTLYREHIGHGVELMQLTLSHQRAVQQVQNVIARGNRVLADREVFRQRAAAIIQGYRTKDLTFRLFRNEALEQYRTLFDLAGRYTYLTAKSYDYETGLLGSSEGQNVFSDIVSSRSLGDLAGGQPQATASTIGDSGLAGTMAQLQSDFSVAEGRLGINNPDENGTVFSLRHELYRLSDDPAITSDDDAWRQTLEQHIVANVLSDSDVATYCNNIRKPDGTPVPGIIIPFSTTIQHGKNYFGLKLAGGDHSFSPSNFATKIYNVGIALPGYVGMDNFAAGDPNGTPDSNAANALSSTPYLYLIPCGSDYMLAPPLGDTNTLRSWTVHDQALPLPYNLGATDFNANQFFSANGTLNEQPWIQRKHQAFRPVADPTFFYSSVPAEFTNSRLIGRSVWNGQWKIVIPAYTLLNNEQIGLNNFAASVKDIKLFLRTYSNSGN